MRNWTFVLGFCALILQSACSSYATAPNAEATQARREAEIRQTEAAAEAANQRMRSRSSGY